ncbi:UPF0496 protein At1g20180 [Jatropha curcas]|uniref:UPF0496 protein At1g20180 n=1 Tax=Jatropha curcas TaxID=180498 RepID=UPI00189406F2|nr:UPF0496 protein At1g20180 [Jatropha curcas]
MLDYFTSLFSDKKELRDVCQSLNVNEEYVSALRTQSYIDFFAKAQSLVNEPPSSSSPLSPFPSSCYKKFSEFLLEPDQETIPAILESTTIFSKIPELKTLILNYFEISAEASKICSHLLTNISQIQSHYQYIQRVIDTTIDDFDYSPEKVKLIVSELNSFIFQRNPFSSPNKHEFKLIHEKYSLALNHLKLKRKKVARKIKLMTCIHKASGVCITAACCLIAISAIVLAAHTLTALVMGPVIFGFPLKSFKKSFGFLRSGSYLMKGCQQLDVAAKGTYILNRDFDTMSRLVGRLHDEVEHNKEVIKFCLERREHKFFLQVVKELKKGDVGFRKQIEELEEHIYLCLLTINRARGLVIKEMTTISSLDSLR